MKFAVFSDIHGNLPALELAIKDCGRVDGYVILGDVVNYGPWSNECVQLIETLPNSVKILGNHEEFFISGQCGETTPLASLFFDYSYGCFTETNVIKQYRKESWCEGFSCTHTLDGRYIFKDTQLELKNNCFIGHSHRQFEIRRNGYRLCNPGSVGQNREFINQIDYLRFESTDAKIEFRSLSYDVEIVISEMKRLSYPKDCIAYYVNKPRK